MKLLTPEDYRNISSEVKQSTMSQYKGRIGNIIGGVPNPPAPIEQGTVSEQQPIQEQVEANIEPQPQPQPSMETIQPTGDNQQAEGPDLYEALFFTTLIAIDKALMDSAEYLKELNDNINIQKNGR